MKLAGMHRGGSSTARTSHRPTHQVLVGLAVLCGAMALPTATAFATGAHLIKDIAPSAQSANPELLTNVGGELFFTADDGRHGVEVWHSDGTKRGTRLVNDINPGKDHSVPVGPHFSTRFASRGRTLFFPANDNIHGGELWRSDGTNAATRMVKDINPGRVPSHPIELTTVGRTLFFVADDGVHGFELWRSDGTADGTQLVKDIDPGAGGSFPFSLINVDGTLFFFVNNAGLAELWRSDGTEAGTEPVKAVDSGSGVSSPFQLVTIGNTLFFTTYDGNLGLELWRSDGTADGTELIKDFHPGGGGDGPYRLASFNGALFFEADDGGGAGRQLWRSDGTRKGTKAVKDGEPYEFASFHGKLYVIAQNPDSGNIELWRSDGTSQGTQAVKVIADNSHANAFGMTKFGGTLLFFTEDPFYVKDRKAKLWRSNGSKAGTKPIDHFAVTPTGIGEIEKSGRTLFFTADTRNYGNELWKATP